MSEEYMDEYWHGRISQTEPSVDFSGNEQYEDGDFGYVFEALGTEFEPSDRAKERNKKLSTKQKVALTAGVLLTAMAGAVGLKVGVDRLTQPLSVRATETPITTIPTHTRSITPTSMPKAPSVIATEPSEVTSEARKTVLTPPLTPEPFPASEIPPGIDASQYLQYIEDLKLANVGEEEAIKMAKEKISDGWFQPKETVEKTNIPVEIQPLDWSRSATPEFYQTTGPTLLQGLAVITEQMEQKGKEILYYSDALAEGKKPIGWLIGRGENKSYVFLFLAREGETPDKADIISVNIKPVSGSDNFIYFYGGKAQASVDERGISKDLSQQGYINGPKQVIIATRDGQIINSFQIGDNDSILPWQEPTAFGDVVYVRTDKSYVDGHIFINQGGEKIKVGPKDEHGNFVFPQTFNNNKALVGIFNQDNITMSKVEHFSIVDLENGQVTSIDLVQRARDWIKDHPEDCPKSNFRSFYSFPSNDGFLVFFDTSPDTSNISNLKYPMIGFKVSNTGEVKHVVTLNPGTLSGNDNWPEKIGFDQAAITQDGRHFAFLTSYYDHGEGITPTLSGLNSSLSKLNLLNLETGEITAIPLNETSLVNWYYQAMDKYHWARSGDLDYSLDDTSTARELVTNYGRINIPQQSEGAFQIKTGPEGDEVWIKLQGGGRIVKPSVLFGEFWSSEDYFPNLERLYSEGQAPDWYRAVRESLPIFYDNLYIRQEVPEKWLVVNINSRHTRTEIIQ